MNTGNKTKKDIIITISCYVGYMILFILLPFIITLIFPYNSISYLTFYMIIATPLIILFSSFIIGYYKSWLFWTAPIFYFIFTAIYMCFVEISSYQNINDFIYFGPFIYILSAANLYAIASGIGLVIGYFVNGRKK